MALANRSEHDAAEVRRERTGRPGAAVRAQVSFVEGEETRKGTDWVASEFNMTLVSFLRDERFNVYAGAARIRA